MRCFDYLRKLLHLRKQHPALAEGKLMHYRPIDEIYMYLKEYEGERFWVIANGNEENRSVPLWDIQHRLVEVRHIEDVLKGETLDFSLEDGIEIEAMEVKILRLVD